MSKNFWQKHKRKIIIGTVATVAVVGGVYITYKYMEAEEAKINDGKMVLDVLENKTVKPIEKNNIYLEQQKLTWEQGGYQDNWNKVSEFAKTLKLAPGEEYLLSESTYWNDSDAPYTGDVTVSHLVCGTGVYPPNQD